MLSIANKTHKFIQKHGHNVRDFNDSQLECIQELSNQDLDGRMFVNPKIDSWIMNQVMFAVSKNPDKYLQILPYMNEHLNFGTLSKIIEFKEQNRCDDIDKLLHVWQDLPHNETRKLQLQNLICRGIEFSDNLYHCSPEEFELTYKELNYKHMGLDFLLQ